jgi:hypothetical protein
MAASTAATVSSGRDGERGCGGGWRCGDGRSGEGLGGPLVVRLGCEGVECAASAAAAGRVRLVLGSAAEEEEDDAGLVEGCAVAAAAAGGGGGLGLAAAFMAEDFFWAG